ncbi:hypothetical protein ACROYT_G005683 [Oculina patagonica]
MKVFDVRVPLLTSSPDISEGLSMEQTNKVCRDQRGRERGGGRGGEGKVEVLKEAVERKSEEVGKVEKGA